MQIHGTHTFNAPKQVVWDALMDPTILATALPGGEALEKTGENEYKAAMKVRVGPVQGKFDGAIELTDISVLESYRMKVNGQGAPGFVNGEGNVRLEAAGGETIMHYDGDVQVGGKIAGVGQRLIDSTAKSMIRQGLVALDAQIQLLAVARATTTTAAAAAAAAPATPHEETVAEATVADDTGVVTPAAAADESAPPPATARPVAPAPPSTGQLATAVAKDVARDLASDVIPLKHQEKLLWFALGALTVLILRWIF
jgi:carbon monoxide dehydrogenase subunit G